MIKDLKQCFYMVVPVFYSTLKIKDIENVLKCYKAHGLASSIMFNAKQEEVIHIIIFGIYRRAAFEIKNCLDAYHLKELDIDTIDRIIEVMDLSEFINDDDKHLLSIFDNLYYHEC